MSFEKQLGNSQVLTPPSPTDEEISKIRTEKAQIQGMLNSKSDECMRLIYEKEQMGKKIIHLELDLKNHLNDEARYVQQLELLKSEIIDREDKVVALQSKAESLNTQLLNSKNAMEKEQTKKLFLHMMECLHKKYESSIKVF